MTHQDEDFATLAASIADGMTPEESAVFYNLYWDDVFGKFREEHLDIVEVLSTRGLVRREGPEYYDWSVTPLGEEVYELLHGDPDEVLSANW